jgi:hypothetical protein
MRFSGAMTFEYQQLSLVRPGIAMKTENKHAGWFRITESNNVLELIDTVK